MAKQHDASGGGAATGPQGLAPLPESLLESPLEYLLAEHFRMRSLCAELRRAADAREVARQAASAIRAYLESDLLRHHQDEDADLYPILRQRVRAEDGLGDILERLAADHERSQALAVSIVGAFAAAPDTDPLVIGQPAAKLMLAFAATEHRHLAIENGIVLVIARKRLKAADVKLLSDAMKTRRGLVN